MMVRQFKNVPHRLEKYLCLFEQNRSQPNNLINTGSYFGNGFFLLLHALSSCAEIVSDTNTYIKSFIYAHM
jgi:hypothetical protein